MILIHIQSSDENQIKEIATFLVQEKLVLTATITQKAEVFFLNKAGKSESEVMYLLKGKTKALLFNEIDNVLRDKYKNNIPVIYSVPIVHMDWEQAEQLVKFTAKI